MGAEINIKTYKWDEVIEGIDGRELLDKFIRERMGVVKNAMMLKAETMIMEAVAEIDRREKQPTPP